MAAFDIINFDKRIYISLGKQQFEDDINTQTHYQLSCISLSNAHR